MFIKHIFLVCLFFGFSLADNDQTFNPASGSSDTAETVSNVTFSINDPAMKPYSSTNFTIGNSITPVSSSTSVTSFPAPNSTMTSAPTTSTTTTASTTSTTTSAPTTSKTTSAPTTSKTTTASTTSTTTSAPTPMPPSTSTPAPPIPEVWNVTDSAMNVTCIIAKMDILLEIHQENLTANFTGNPKTKKVEAKGECGTYLQTLEIIWPHDNKSASLLFSFNGTENKYFVSSLTTTILLNTSAGSETFNDTQHLNLYETGKNTSYSCPSYVLNFEINKASVKLSMNEIQIEAFRMTNSNKFSSANYCNGEVPDIVPLIVGLALAGLVIVVVIGYFIGRRRSQARGYLSM